MKIFLEKLRSRKFLAAIAGVVTGLAMVFGLDENIISTVAGAVTAVASLITYIITEGRIDTAAVGKAIDAVKDAAECLTDELDGDIC